MRSSLGIRPGLPLGTLLIAFTNVPGPVENANYWRPFFKNHVFPTGMPGLSGRLIFSKRKLVSLTYCVAFRTPYDTHAPIG